MKTIDDKTRARVALGWEESGLSQAEYAASRGISERSLRQWRRRFVPAGAPVEQVRAIVNDAIEKLRALLAALSENTETAPAVPSAGSAAARDEGDAAAGPSSEPDVPPFAGPASPEAPPPDTGRQGAATTVSPSAAEQRRVRPGRFCSDFM